MLLSDIIYFLHADHVSSLIHQSSVTLAGIMETEVLTQVWQYPPLPPLGSAYG